MVEVGFRESYFTDLLGHTAYCLFQLALWVPLPCANAFRYFQFIRSNGNCAFAKHNDHILHSARQAFPHGCDPWIERSKRSGKTIHISFYSWYLHLVCLVPKQRRYALTSTLQDRRAKLRGKGILKPCTSHHTACCGFGAGCRSKKVPRFLHTLGNSCEEIEGTESSQWRECWTGEDVDYSQDEAPQLDEEVSPKQKTWLRRAEDSAQLSCKHFVPRETVREEQSERSNRRCRQ